MENPPGLIRLVFPLPPVVPPPDRRWPGSYPDSMADDRQDPAACHKGDSPPVGFSATIAIMQYLHSLRGTVCLLSLVGALLLLGAPALAQPSWPEFRGPTGDGHAPDAHLPVTLDANVVQWKTPVHGKGWSSPVVQDRQIWLTTATVDGKKMSALCVDLDTGKVLHDLVICTNQSPDFCHPANSYATPTPAIDEQFVYLHFGKYATVCLNRHTGKEMWRRSDLECDHWRGPASSPILYQNLLVVAFDGYDQQYVVGLDRKTGKTVWKTTREIDYGTDNGDQKKAYATAAVLSIHDQPHIVCPGAVATVAYRPSDGEPLWTVYHGGMNASSRPIMYRDLIFLTNGSGKMVAVRILSEADGFQAETEWSRRATVPKKGSLLLVDGRLYMATDDGIIACIDALTGEAIWRHRMSSPFAASPVHADGRIYFFSCEGDVTVFKPGDKMEILSESTLGDGFWASPAIVGDRMILRSQSHLYCCGLPRKSPDANSPTPDTNQ